MYQANDNPLDARQDPRTTAGPAPGDNIPGGATPGRVMHDGPGATNPGEGHLDPARGLALMGGNAPLYQRILASFVETYANLRLDLANPEDRRTLHSLKGLSGNLGASRLRELAAALEMNIDAALLTSFYQELSLVLNEIRALLAPGKPIVAEQRGAIGEPVVGVATVGTARVATLGVTDGAAVDTAGGPSGGTAGGSTGEEASPATIRDLFAELRSQAQAGNSRNCREAISRLGALQLSSADQALLKEATRLLNARDYQALADL